MKYTWLSILLAFVSPVQAAPEVIEKGHAEYIYELAFSTDGKQMASAAGDNTAIIWDLATRKKLHILKHESAVYTAVFSPDGKTVATGNGYGFVALWDAATGKPLKRMQVHEDAIYSLTFSPDGLFLASAGGSTDGGDTVCRLHSPDDLKVLKKFAGHERQVYGLAFSPDGKTLASSSSDKTIRLWNLASGKARVLKAHTSDVYRGSFSPDGTRFASPSQDGTIRLWSVETGEVMEVFKSKSKDPFYTANFSPDGKWIAGVGDDRSVTLLRSTDLEALSSEELSKYALFAVIFHPKTGLPYAAGEDGNIYRIPKQP